MTLIVTYFFFTDVFEIPFDPEWEVDRNLFVITETLGEGAFGVVVKATASGLVRGEEQHTTVAIKMLKGKRVYRLDQDHSIMCFYLALNVFLGFGLYIQFLLVFSPLI